MSILGDAWFMFPEQVPLGRRLKDLLEPEVDEKFYMDQERVSEFIEGMSDESRERLEGD